MKNKPMVLYVVSAILIIYMASIIIIDPYNYFETGIVSQDVKNRIANPLNPRLHKIIAYKKNPCKNILLGDSRIASLDPNEIKKITQETYFNFGYGASSINEIYDNFWFATKYENLENVYIGIGFNNFNAYNNKNLFNKEIRNSTFLYYIFNSTNVRIIFFMIKDILSKDKLVLGVPDMNQEQLWEKKLNEGSNKFYGLYKYPNDFYKKLSEIKDYCKKNNINLVFYLPPSYIEAQNKIKEFALTSEYIKFKKDIYSLGKTFDFDYDSELTRNKENFLDPLHLKYTKRLFIINIVFQDSLELLDPGVRK